MGKWGANFMARREYPKGDAGLPSISNRTETLTYLCEIIFELKQLAEKSGCRSLAAILGAALVEARAQRDEYN